jgi:hypothetical protein
MWMILWPDPETAIPSSSTLVASWIAKSRSVSEVPPRLKPCVTIAVSPG